MNAIDVTLLARPGGVTLVVWCPCKGPQPAKQFHGEACPRCGGVGHEIRSFDSLDALREALAKDRVGGRAP